LSIALDATYSLGRELSGVGVYCREILFGIAAAHPEQSFRFCYRPHRYFASFHDALPPNCARYLLHDRWRVPVTADLFHGLNQRMPQRRMRRSVCTFHDLFVLTSEYSSPEFRDRFGIQAREAARRSDVIIAVSAFTASQVVDLLDVEPARIRVIHHGVRAPASLPQQREPIVLSVGAIQHRKNTRRLVEAFERVEPPWRLVLAGSRGYGSEQILERISASPARDRIEVTGYIDADRLESLYSRASIFVFPSLDEGFGIPVIEAMAHGLPVIASNRPALMEVCGDAALHVKPESADEIADALERVITDETVRATLITKGLERAAKFTWESAVEKTWNVYRELL
jgi:glycosyltransferase involved in cell wall biosynthesis